MEQENKNNSAKFTFFYLVSLVALAFMAVAVGAVIFQIINKYIVDVIASYKTCYSPEALKFAISSIIIATPVYSFFSQQIYKNLFSGRLDKESGIRKWLTYFIFFVSSLVIIGYLIAIIYNFLDGELTIKFTLKTLTALLISSGIFSYYAYDIKRKEIIGKKNKVIKIYFWVSLAIVVISLILGLVFVESPFQTRQRKHDQAILDNFNTIKYAMEEFYANNKKLPQDFDELLEVGLLTKSAIRNPANEEKFGYNIISEDEYEICTNFQTSNKDSLETCGRYPEWLEEEWEHDKGYQCLKKKIISKEALDNAPRVPERL